MSDQIFDYFGSSSPRKVEPLDENEMFDDLMPVADENPTADEIGPDRVEVVEAVVVENDEPHEEQAAEVIVAESVQEDAPSQDQDHEEEDSLGVAESHWDELASSLGLEPIARDEPTPTSRPKKKQKPSSSKSKRGTDKRKSNRSDKSKTAKSTSDDFGSGVEEFFGLSEHPSEQTTETKKDNVLSEMFVPTEDVEFDSVETVDSSDSEPVSSEDTSFDEDPFAAFSGSKSSDPEGDDDESIEMDSDDLSSLNLIAESSEETITDPDFVEFEVTDLSGKHDEGRDQRSKRRRRPQKTDRESDGSKETAAKANEIDVKDERPRRRRPKRGGSQEHGADQTSSGPDHDESRSRESRRTERGRNGRSDSSREVRAGNRTDRDGDRESDGKKKPKIPTWDEAIACVVEKNIKRHKSNVGRGGKRRRN